MGAGIRAEISVPASSPTPFEGIADGSTPIENVRRTCHTGPADGSPQPTGVVIEFLAAADVTFPERVETVFDYGDRAAYRFEAPYAADSPFAALDRHGVPTTDATVRDGRLFMTFHATDLPTLRAVLGDIRESCADMQVVRLLQSSAAPDVTDLVTVDRSELTDRQREVLTTAYDAGYFDHPKGANASEVAASLDIERSTFTEHVAAAQQKLLAAMVG